MLVQTTDKIRLSIPMDCIVCNNFLISGQIAIGAKLFLDNLLLARLSVCIMLAIIMDSK